LRSDYQQVTKLAQDLCKLQRQFNIASRRLEENVREKQVLEQQLIDKENEIERLKKIKYENNTILLERQLVVDELNMCNSRLMHHLKCLESKLRELEMDNMRQETTTSEKVRQLQENVGNKNAELQTLTNRLNMAMESLKDIVEKNTHFEELLKSVFKENCQLKTQMKKLGVKHVDQIRRLSSKVEMTDMQLLKKRMLEFENNFNLVFKEYTYINDLFTNKMASFEETKAYLENTFHEVVSYLKGKGVARIEEIDFKKLMCHPKYREVESKLVKLTQITESLLKVLEKLKQDKVVLENEKNNLAAELKESKKKIDKLLRLNEKYKSEKNVLHGAPTNKPNKTDSFNDVSSDFPTFPELSIVDLSTPCTSIEDVVSQLNLTVNKLEERNEELQNENERLREEMENMKCKMNSIDNDKQVATEMNYQLKQELEVMRAKCIELKEESNQKSCELEWCSEIQRDAELVAKELLEHTAHPPVKRRSGPLALLNWMTRRRSTDSSPESPVVLPRYWSDDENDEEVKSTSDVRVSEVELSFDQRLRAARDVISKIQTEFTFLKQIFENNSFQLRDKEEEILRKTDELCKNVEEYLDEEIK
jgi:chromosome segregation ATPase